MSSSIRSTRAGARQPLRAGQITTDGGVRALKSCWQRSYQPELKEQLLLAISMMRLSGAVDFLLDLVASGPESTALSAMSALQFQRYDPGLRERLAVAVKKAGSRAVEARMNRDFGSGG